MMQTVELDAAEWQQVMTVLGGSTGFPWTLTNPLLMRIGQQIQEQTAGAERIPANGAGASKRQRANAE